MQTDGQTHDDSIYRASIESRGNNRFSEMRSPQNIRCPLHQPCRRDGQCVGYVCANIKHSWSLCSKCPSCARIQARRRGRHCLIASSMNTWWKCSHSSIRRDFSCSTSSRIRMWYTRSCSFPQITQSIQHRTLYPASTLLLKRDILRTIPCLLFTLTAYVDCVNKTSLPKQWLQ